MSAKQINFDDMVCSALNSQAGAEVFCTYLRAGKARADAERDIITADRKRHPGRTDEELLKPHKNRLDRACPRLTPQQAYDLTYGDREASEAGW